MHSSNALPSAEHTPPPPKENKNRQFLEILQPFCSISIVQFSLYLLGDQ